MASAREHRSPLFAPPLGKGELATLATDTLRCGALSLSLWQISFLCPVLRKPPGLVAPACVQVAQTSRGSPRGHAAGQTFAEYLDAQPVRRSERFSTIYLCLVGGFSEAEQRILDLTQEYLAIFFDCPVKVIPPGEAGCVSSSGHERREPEAR